MSAELSFPMPKNPYAIIHIHLSRLQNCAMVNVTSAIMGESSGALSPLGDFVYAMPDRNNPQAPLSTVLCSIGSNLDIAIRMAKILVRRLDLPVYVGSSVNLAGCTVEEEMAAFVLIVDKITSNWNQMRSNLP